MIALWIFAILLALVFLKIAFLFFKRIRLIHKLKKQSDEIQFLRNRFRSVFIFDGKPDLIVKKGDRSYSLSIITTPFQRVRYHFYNPERMDIYLVNKGYFLIHFNIRGQMATLERVFKIKKYKIKFDFQSDLPHFMIPNPAPPLLTKVEGTKISVLGNGDQLFGNTKICGLKFFLENVISNTKEDA